MNIVEQIGLVITIVLFAAFYIRLINMQYAKARRIRAKAQKKPKRKTTSEKSASSF